ncbi:MBL fold metallo-hydrolase [Desulfoluna sp.]|uniref:MBL fold metallo-hydrolase n=1 Tax=Desulfoluna sp. TaxID=2045199 RepID=UPI002621B198|nr:MBL fold metallo-hydrolase [Desulfoluna sp.]
MLNEKILVENNKWQDVSGTKQARIFPHMVTPDIMSSNSFAIESANQFIIIDPGGYTTQWDYLTGIVTPLSEKKSLPLMIYLTHCHVDHCLMIGRCTELKATRDVKVAIHEAGAQILAKGETKMSMAELYGYSLSPFTPDIVLFQTEQKAQAPLLSSDFDGQIDDLHDQTGRQFLRQRMDLGGGDFLEIYHTPGHSPDSVCYRIGTLIFISDMLSAVNPMVAGIVGWDRENYIDSIRNLIWLLDSSDIQLCFPGHGGPVTAENAKKKMMRILDNLKGLGSLKEFNRDSLTDAKIYALDLLEEVSDVFTILAGRLYALSYHLDKLGESEEAEKYLNMFDADQVEFYIIDFKSVVEQVNQGELIDLHLVFEAANAIRKIIKVFDQKKFDVIISKSYLRRVSCLLKDFLTVIRGVDDAIDLEEINLNHFSNTLIKEIKTCLYDDESIFDALGDDFLTALATRIAYVPIFKELQIDVFHGEDIKPVFTDYQRFSDAFKGLLELIAVAKVKKLSLSTFSDENRTGIKIMIDDSNNDIIMERKFKMQVRKFQVCQALLSRIHTPGERGFCLSFCPDRSMLGEGTAITRHPQEAPGEGDAVQKGTKVRRFVKNAR